VHPEYSLVIGLHLLIALVGSLVALAVPVAGFALVLAAATSLYLDQNTRIYLLRRLFFRRASQVVVSPGSKPDAALRVVLMAHYDAAKTGFLFGERTTRAAGRIPERMRMLLGPVRVVFWGGIVPLLGVCALRLAGVDATWLGAVQLIPTMILLIGIALGIDIALSDVVPGACDNASGVAAVLSAAASLDEEGLANVDLWVILPGGEEANAEGMASYMRSHRKQFDRERTLFVNLDSVSYGTPSYVAAEGAVVTYSMDQRLVELCAEAATGPDAPLPVRVPLHTDALPVRIRGYGAISIVGTRNGIGAPYYHTHDDTPDRVDDGALAAATDLAATIVRAIDRDLDGAPGRI